MLRAARERERSAGDRHAAAEQRRAAALDRKHSEHDRRMAALDRSGAETLTPSLPEPNDIRREVAVHPGAVAGARHAVAGLRLPVTVAETVALVVSELVTNSIVHAGIAADDSSSC